MIAIQHVLQDWGFVCDHCKTIECSMLFGYVQFRGWSTQLYDHSTHHQHMLAITDLWFPLCIKYCSLVRLKLVDHSGKQLRREKTIAIGWSRFGLFKKVVLLSVFKDKVRCFTCKRQLNWYAIQKLGIRLYLTNRLDVVVNCDKYYDFLAYCWWSHCQV